jgi:hypothetical protein
MKDHRPEKVHQPIAIPMGAVAKMVKRGSSLGKAAAVEDS